nr:putative nuclease HARBI1 [Hydra vulgaris]
MAFVPLLANDLQSKKIKTYPTRLNPLTDYDDDEFFKRFRFTKHTFTYICSLIRNECEPQTHRSKSLSTEQQLAITLRFYATGSFLELIGDSTNKLAKSSVSRTVTHVTDLLARLIDNFISFPSDIAFQQSIQQGFLERFGFPGITGVVDGTRVKIQAPSGDQEPYYPRSISEYCRLAWKCARFRILGDSGYPCHSYLLTPILHPVSPQEVKYNIVHRKTRCIIERKFGILKRRFHCLHGEIRMKPVKVCRIVAACAVLHNIAIKQSERFELPDNEISTDDQDDQDHVTCNDGHDGQLYRRLFIEEYFS